MADARSDLQAEPGTAVTLAGNATGPWDANVLWSWEQVDAGGNALAQPTVTRGTGLGQPGRNLSP